MPLGLTKSKWPARQEQGALIVVKKPDPEELKSENERKEERIFEKLAEIKDLLTPKEVFIPYVNSIEHMGRKNYIDSNKCVVEILSHSDIYIIHTNIELPQGINCVYELDGKRDFLNRNINGKTVIIDSVREIGGIVHISW